jgi:hypothetical protein
MRLKKKPLLLLFLFLIACSVSLHAQNSGTLKGIVREAGSNEAVIGAIVFDLNDKTHGSVSDVNGNYLLNLKAGRRTIVCSIIGMKADTFIVLSDSAKMTEHDFLLKSSSIQLETMVVSAGKYERKL